MKKIILFFIVLYTFVGSGCDVINEESRLIPREDVPVTEEKPVKRVLLLDFTDQNCVNCLKATAEIINLKGFFADTLVAVSIHANPLPYPLRTKEGNDYEKHFNAKEHPTGIVDGGGDNRKSYDPQVWGGFILDRRTQESSVDIDYTALFDPESRELNLSVHLTGYRDLSNVKLLLWIIENNIVNWQLMLDGTTNREYVHNHVFRSSINTTWGEEFSIQADEEKDFNYLYTLNATWKPEDISIVGFVYDISTDEVFDVKEIELIRQENNEE
jgi:hypothetical protein